MSKREDIHRILVVGSGPIVIGQACEFDYSGTQAVKALKEEGYEVLLVNPNPATVQTTAGIADHIYLEPLKTEYVEQIFQRDRPDAILTTMGGQTGLNLAMELSRKGLLDKYNVQVIGASIKSIELAEDRGKFKQVVSSLGLESPRSEVVHTIQEGVKAKDDIGYPVIIRPSFTLGGFGGSIAHDDAEFTDCIERALETSPVHEALVEESLIGWKEFEMEVMRDRKDNAIIVCSIENIDPMGVHTGDSITIAPIQTLDDQAYQAMRDASINILRAVGVDCGGSNVQFAVNPDTGKMVVIEMNPRVSRSSALASKATGFPIARCSAKLAVGYTLDEVVNEITGKSVSCFEPALDYCAVKVPRFELEKFPLPYSALGTQMRSVGEALALGRTALEALNKAIRASERKFEGLTDMREGGKYTDDEIDHILHSAHPLRLMSAYTMIVEHGPSILPELSKLTGFDRWFLYQLVRQAEMDKKLSKGPLTKELILEAKRYGMSDKRIATLSHQSEDAVYRMRTGEGIVAVAHHVDTCAGEFQALTPYCYTTYGEKDETTPLGKDAVIILASGPNRIGQGLEFDTCCTLSSLAFRKLGRKTIMVNSNPETVSTDFNISDRLYIEPLTAEHVKEIMRLEGTKNVVVQLGGQTPLNMADDLQAAGANIIGTSLDGLDRAGDRERFSQVVRKLGLRNPANQTAHSRDEIIPKALEVGFPVLLRPSFVLGGRGMFIVDDEEGLQDFLEHSGVEITPKAPVLIDQFLEDAFEYDLDAVSDGKSIYIGGILQHIEAAGIHSGDSAAVFPPYKAIPSVLSQMREWALKLAQELQVKGLMNIQFASKEDKLYIIEVNPRGSRTVPFISKASGVNLVEAAVRVWNGEDLVAQGLVGREGTFAEGHCITGWAIKEAVFSFDRFSNVDPALGPEMRSTGEAIGMGRSFGEAYAKSQAAAGNRLPTSGNVVISVTKKDRQTIVPIARQLQKLGFHLFATHGTARDLFDAGILCNVVLKVQDGHPNIVDMMHARQVDLVINTPMGYHARRSDDDIRTAAMRLKIPYTTTTSAAAAAVQAIAYEQEGIYTVRELPQ
ncbi:MAG: carbamoyl-phosphate synthase large subunit [Sphaerochaeta sp.]|jgi:carbamoyl-phosphate synthase large subunit|nr:carbamoyl-phosphate synthase large subunit [Sphaerochaeta sp.]MCH3920581.1 carbamoyl-phosphate synthase large subunit [Sphaerochaeta sp.]MCI2045694.1 carbamoyl-phosphate synthase large subunit [Sphaerochaeta sp.]MCI2096617.1 carbamoyl-phosphate synthase large subunit [Sphaerochaeta sp.]MCI2103562.1 carbamoyl-phosphate synthase large subunit [Sphaerochaeta sp.]